MSNIAGVIAVTSLALEARIALGPGVSVICNQGSRLVAALEVAIGRGAAGIISFGIAGGLAPNLAAGDWVVGAGVRAGQDLIPTDRNWARRLLGALAGAAYADIVGVDTPIADPVEKHRLHSRTGAAVVDTESHIAARIAAAHRIPFAAFRVVIDPAHKRLPPAAMVGLRHDGTPDIPAVLRSVVRQPSQLPALFQTALDARIAERSLHRGRQQLGAALGCPFAGNLALDLPAPDWSRSVLSAPRIGSGL